MEEGRIPESDLARLSAACYRPWAFTAAGRLPRVHDFRHTFAVHALLRWYREGEDVQAKLPLLSTYMGHVSIVSTAYYLPLRRTARRTRQ